MLQLLSLHLNIYKELQFTTASRSEFQIFTDLLLNSLPHKLIIYAKTFNFEVVDSRIGIENIKECVNLEIN